jgi:hypothetical protein
MTFVVANLKSALKTIFEDVADGNTSDSKATSIGGGIHDFAITGTPMTANSGGTGLAPGQTVVSFKTIPAPPGIVSTNGKGGIDSSSEGSGLSSAKATLKSDLKTTFKKSDNTGATAADQISKAIEKFFKAAKILTKVTGASAGGGDCPAPIGPLANEAYTAVGIGGIDKDTPGTTLAVSKPTFITTLKDMFKDGGFPTDYDDAATKWADAIEKYFKEAKVDTTDSGTASGGAAVVNPSTGSGATTTASACTGSGSGSLS